jgi:hypothetical protein
MEAYNMISRNMSLLMFTFVEAPLKKKLLFVDSLLRVGLYEEAINILKSEDFTKEKFDSYSK